ncbi:hypothetical protein ACFWM0_00140 [Streptomyces sp. NPDC058405]|uniref:hypothetical protein n=1 Tax=Streptomyces sp. NPDC058405 TaxID=3346482 RepID=UPI0036462BC2
MASVICWKWPIGVTQILLGWTKTFTDPRPCAAIVDRLAPEHERKNPPKPDGHPAVWHGR